MKPLNANLILEKNKLYSKQPWVILCEIDVDGEPPWRFAAHPEAITWNEYEWAPLGAVIEPMNESGDGRLEGLDIHVANVNQVVSAYVEHNNLLARIVTLYIVHKAHLEVTTDIISYTYRINRIQTSEETAVFELGHEDLFSIYLPWQRFMRDRCRHRYRDDYCGYPGDEFEADTKQNFVARDVDGNPSNCDGAKMFGWNIMNSTYASTADVDLTWTRASERGRLVIVVKAGGPRRWWNATKTGPFVYKLLPGDFDVNVSQTYTYTNTNVGLLVQSIHPDVNDWIFFGCSASNNRLYIRNTVNSVSSDSTGYSFAYQIRIKRVGAVFTFYRWTGTTWNQLTTRTRNDVSHELRVGPVAMTNDGGTSSHVCWYYFRGTDNNGGGLTTCDYTLDGPNGCRNHGNQPKFGGAPALPYGPLRGL